MLLSIFRLLSIFSRERPGKLEPGGRYRATVGLGKVRPGMGEEDAKNWLMTMGFTPTGKAEVWKADERFLSRLPKGSVLKAERLLGFFKPATRIRRSYAIF